MATKIVEQIAQLAEQSYRDDNVKRRSSRYASDSMPLWVITPILGLPKLWLSWKHIEFN